MTPTERETDALRDARRMCEIAAFIVEQGEGSFFDAGDPRGRLAAKALVIDLCTALQAAPGWQSRNQEMWRRLRKTRDRFAHFYVNFDYEILWGVLVNRIPALCESLDEEGV